MIVIDRSGMSEPSVGIIGGGFTGLAAATTLCKLQPNMEIVLYESTDRLGGLASGFKEPGWKSSLEDYYHHWFTGDSAIVEHAKAWGVADHLFFKRVSTVLECANGEFHPLDSVPSLLRFPCLPLRDRLHMGLGLLRLKTTQNWEALEQNTATDWCEKWMGKAALNGVWHDLLKGKFGPHADKVNMAWLWARIHSRTARLGSIKGGFQHLVNAAEQHLLQKKVHVLTGTPIERIQPSPNGMYTLSAKNLPPRQHNAVISTVAPQLMARFFSGSKAEQGIQQAMQPAPAYLGALVCIFALKRPLRGESHYWYSLRKTKSIPFLAVVQHTQLVDPAEFDNQHICYVADYCEHDSKSFLRADDEVQQLALLALRKIDPSLQASDVIQYWVKRAPWAQPVPECGASKRLLPLEVEGHSGLFQATMAQVYPWDRGTHHALELGERVARKLMKTDALTFTSKQESPVLLLNKQSP